MAKQSSSEKGNRNSLPKKTTNKTLSTEQQCIPTDSWEDPHDRHPAMSFEEFIMYRFTRVL